MNAALHLKYSDLIALGIQSEDIEVIEGELCLSRRGVGVLADYAARKGNVKVANEFVHWIDNVAIPEMNRLSQKRKEPNQ